MITPSFGVSRTFDTTLERLWAAFTQAGELAAWAPPPGSERLRSAMNLSAGGVFRFGAALPDGRQVWGLWDIRRVEPQTLLTFVQRFTDEKGGPVRNPLVPGWPPQLRVEIRMALQGGGATVTVNLSPLDPTADEIAAFRKAFAALSAGWESALNRLDARLSRP